jgi:glycosyltransferase involved in cell wall biosynthesis
MEVMRVPSDKIDVIYLGADGNLVETGADEERSIRAKYNLQGNFILSVTASHPHKNLDGLVRSYALATRNWENPPPLVIVGIKGKFQRELENLVSSQHAQGRIIVTGWVTASELSALYRAATLFVFLSKYEGFGFPVLEAMTAGVPVISSSATSLPELVGDAGVLLNPDDEPAIAHMIQSVLADQSLRNDLIKRGFARVARFTWRQTAENTLASYGKAALGAAKK